MSSQPLAQQARPESCGGRQKRWKKCQLSFRNKDFTCGCRALKAWGRGGLFKIHVSSGVSSGENEALGGWVGAVRQQTVGKRPKQGGVLAAPEVLDAFSVRTDQVQVMCLGS